MPWYVLSLSYALGLGLMLYFWNRHLHSLLAIFTLALCIFWLLSPLLGIQLTIGLCFVSGILLSLLGWWHAAQIVKPITDRIRLVDQLGVIKIGLLHIAISILPIMIWTNWKIAIATAVINGSCYLLASAESTNQYVRHKALQIANANPELSLREALALAERELKHNVDEQ